MERRDKKGGEPKQDGPFGGLDDTGGLGGADQAGQRKPPRESEDVEGTYEDANITGSDVTGGMGRRPEGRTPGREERESDEPPEEVEAG